MARLLKGKSLGDVARGTGLSRSMVTRVFSGDRRPSVETASKVAGYLGVSMDNLYGAWAADNGQ